MPGRRVVLILFSVLLLGSCGRPLAPPSAQPSTAGDAQACRALVSALPARLEDQPQTARSEFAVAWGTAPVTLRCGVGQPPSYQPTSELIQVDDVSWLPETGGERVVFTAVGRAPLVEVGVPASANPPTSVLVDLGPLVAEHTEIVSPEAKPLP